MLRRLLLPLAIFVFLVPRPASATKPVCGAVPGEKAAVATVLASAEAQCPCASALDKKTYAKCVRTVVSAAVANQTLPVQCEKAAVAAAKRSTCGRPGAVTCCKTAASGKQRCQVKPSAEKCTPPKGGTAVAGASASCYDACSPPLSQRSLTDTEVDVALDAALQGLDDPWESDFETMLARFLAETGARLEAPAPSPNPALQPRAGLPPCYGDPLCLPLGVKYCGPGNSAYGLFAALLRLAAR